ncbi:MAG: FAD-dependent oxidoreductase [Planctomycetia bacterium]|nr:FAD-dependent oxidoreductase [Planctomycetia bacterium]
MRVAVIGAGPAGMTAALQLSRGGAQVTVYEADERVGGLARSLELWGQTVDLGPHRFFSTEERVNRLWLDVVGRDYRFVNRLTRIYYEGHFYDYPLRPINALRNMGVVSASRCLASYLKEKAWPSYSTNANGSFESWVVDRFGRRLFEMFFKPYSEKLWGIACSDLDADFAAQRIRKFSLGEAVVSALFPRRAARHKTLVDHFAYPLHGTGSVYAKMADRVRANGGEIRLRCPVRRVIHEAGQVNGVELDDGQCEMCDHVISTMPLTLLVRSLGDIPAEVEQAVAALRFRNTILVYLHVDSDALFADQWIYVHSPDLLMGRVTNFRNWVPELHGDKRTTILALEYWSYATDALWTESDQQMIERAKVEMQATGLLRGAQVLDSHVVRIPRCYPVYARGYKVHVQKIAAYLRNFRGLTAIGRYGAFKYNNQDHSILMGILAADNLLENKAHDLWSINADAESYQEAALIDETGLSQTPATAP